MAKITDEIKYDLKFLKSHTLQPRWWKIAKVFFLAAVLLGFYLIFGLTRTALFFGCFVLLSLVMHFTYRFKTQKYTRDWLDFKVQEDKTGKPARIGKYYYPAVILIFLLSAVFSLIVTR